MKINDLAEENAQLKPFVAALEHAKQTKVCFAAFLDETGLPKEARWGLHLLLPAVLTWLLYLVGSLMYLCVPLIPCDESEAQAVDPSCRFAPLQLLAVMLPLLVWLSALSIALIVTDKVREVPFPNIFNLAALLATIWNDVILFAMIPLSPEVCGSC